MKIGLVGLSNSGKTTIFNLLTHQTLPVGPFFTQSTEVHLGVAKVVDHRLAELYKEHPRAHLKYAEIVFVDTAGFMAGDTGKHKTSDAHFFTSLRDVDALAYVLAGFHNPEVLQVFDEVDPLRDLKLLEQEMMLSDLDSIEKRIERIDKELQSSKDKNTPEKTLLIKCRESLEKEQPLRNLDLNDDEEKLISGFRFISRKPAMALLNVDEKDIKGSVPDDLATWCVTNGFSLMGLCGKIEEEISECSEEEQAELLSAMGISEPALPKFIHSANALMDLISFFTANDREAHAWNIKKGTTAHEAAGKIHTDMQRGFIRAEVLAFDDYHQAGGMKQAKEKKMTRLEGKEYIVKDGDIIEFRFNV